MNKVLVFDLDDTLFPEEQFVLSGFQAVDIWLNEKMNISGFYNVCVNIYNSGFRRNIFNKTFDKINVKYTKELIEKMVQIYRLHKPRINLLDESKEVLLHFFNKIPLSIITDGYYHTQKNKVVALDIAEFFDYIIYSDVNGKKSWKPSPWSYLEIMKHYNKKYSELEFIYVADNPLKDFITAKKLNWKTIHILRSKGEYSNAKVSQEHQADFKIDSLIGLKNLIGLKKNE